VSALGHFLEREGVPTTIISLIRPHTERMRPPRALWVPFELGRPFGTPNDAAFQTRVLEAALALLEAPAGPVLEDFPEDAAEEAEPGTWACPLPLAEASAGGSLSEREAFAQEFARIRPWYDLALERRGRTTLGLSGLSADDLGEWLVRLLDDPLPEAPRGDVALGSAVKFAAEDLRALYGEAATVQPGAKLPSASEFEDWFWEETAAGALLKGVRERLLAADDASVKLIAAAMLVPAARLGA
jgi:hypothetical protein